MAVPQQEKRGGASLARLSGQEEKGGQLRPRHNGREKSAIVIDRSRVRAGVP